MVKRQGCDIINKDTPPCKIMLRVMGRRLRSFRAGHSMYNIIYKVNYILNLVRKYVCYHIIERVIFYVYPTGAGRTDDK